jgi:hypothetical protein
MNKSPPSKVMRATKPPFKCVPRTNFNNAANGSCFCLGCLPISQSENVRRGSFGGEDTRGVFHGASEISQHPSHVVAPKSNTQSPNQI